MTSPSEETVVRYCHGCRQYDDHPRFTHISSFTDPAGDKLYHYDCIPVEVAADHEIDATHPAVAATAAGLRGEDVRWAVRASELIPEEGRLDPELAPHKLSQEG